MVGVVKKKGMRLDFASSQIEICFYVERFLFLYEVSFYIICKTVIRFFAINTKVCKK